MKSNESALAAFIGKRAVIDNALARLTALSADHFNVHPDDVGWSHVGDLQRYETALVEMSDIAFKEGEYASDVEALQQELRTMRTNHDEKARILYSEIRDLKARIDDQRVTIKARDRLVDEQADTIADLRDMRDRSGSAIKRPATTDATHTVALNNEELRIVELALALAINFWEDAGGDMSDEGETIASELHSELLAARFPERDEPQKAVEAVGV